MSTTRFAIESHMDELELKYFSQEDGTNMNWILLFGPTTGLLIRLLEDGEFLLIRSLPLVQLDKLPGEHAERLPKELLKRNDNLKLGHYSVDNHVVFEVGFPVEDGELTQSQLSRLISCVASEIGSFHERLPDMLSGATSNSDPLDNLMQRLIEGDHPNAA